MSEGFGVASDDLQELHESVSLVCTERGENSIELLAVLLKGLGDHGLALGGQLDEGRAGILRIGFAGDPALSFEPLNSSSDGPAGQVGFIAQGGDAQ